MTNYIELTPAYGRDYSSAKAVRADWAAGRDFQVATYGPDMGRYANSGDIPNDTKVLIRYAKLTKVVAL